MIVVTTPTGQIGHQVANALLDRGVPVRVVARDPSRLGPRIRDRAEVIKGSHGDREVISEALAGADSLFWVVPPNPRANSVHGYVLDFTRPMTEVVTQRGVQRVVGVSTLGRGIAKNAGQISAALAMDELIESTGVNYRALRMPGFMDNMLQQIKPIQDQHTFYQTISPGHKLPTCATRDIAAVV